MCVCTHMTVCMFVCVWGGVGVGGMCACIMQLCAHVSVCFVCVCVCECDECVHL